MGGGAWTLLVGGVICLVISVNRLEPCMINSATNGFPLDSDSYRGARLIGGGREGQYYVCDYLRCPGPHACYTYAFNEHIKLAKRPGKSFQRAS